MRVRLELVTYPASHVSFHDDVFTFKLSNCFFLDELRSDLDATYVWVGLGLGLG
jgi:hypothetical protein